MKVPFLLFPIGLDFVFDASAGVLRIRFTPLLTSPFFARNFLRWTALSGVRWALDLLHLSL